jgi:hypothetical protein
MKYYHQVHNRSQRKTTDVGYRSPRWNRIRWIDVLVQDNLRYYSLSTITRIT